MKFDLQNAFAAPLSRLLIASAVLLGFANLATVTQAVAQGGGGSGSGADEVSGGTDSTTGTGGSGQNGIVDPVTTGGGGGGAGATGGNGGAGSHYAGSGGSGGAASVLGVGGSGGDGSASPTGGEGAGGGGGGAHGAIVSTSGALSTSNLTGGNGGKGGNSPPSNNIGGAGGGGAGGYGAVVTGNGGVFANSFAVHGGSGGDGGNGGLFTVDGSGGSGGIGIDFTGTGNSLTNLGSVTGGSGGTGATVGNGGSGVVGSGLTVINAGTIAGGVAGDGVTRADAITFAGGTNSLILSSGGTTGTLTGGIGVTGALSIDPGTAAGATVTLSNVIHDVTTAGSVTKVGVGTLVLSGSNTYSGGTTLSAGTLRLGVDEVFNTPGNYSSGIVSSAIGTGKLTFNGGVLQSMGPFSERTIANAVQITTNGGTIDSGGGFFRITGDITDAPGSPGGKLTFESLNGGAGEREIILSGNNTYSGISYLDSGTVIANSTTALSPNSAFQVNTGAVLTLSGFSNTIASLADGASGGGAVQNGSASGTATLTLSGAQGGTTSFSGVLRDGSGGEGGLGGPVLNVVKNGASTQILAGTNQYTGTTTVNGGVLEVDGSIASSSMTTVNASATLSGTGTVGATQINASSIFAPGNGTAGSSMTVSGSLALQAGAMYLVALNPTTSSFANVAGTATLGGATVNASYANGSYVSRQYTILTAGSVSGTFGSLVNTNLPANFSASLSYDPTHAYLDLALNFTPSGPNFGGGLNINQQNVANALINFYNSTGGIPLVYGALSPAGLTQASGELATGSQQTTFDAMNLFMGLLTDPFVAGRGAGSGAGGAGGYADAGALGYADSRHKPSDALAAIYTKAPPAAPFEPRWSTWVSGYGGSQTTSGNAVLGSNNTSSSIYGTAVGADYRFSPFTIAGLALAGGGTNFSVNGSGSGHSDLFQAGAFVRHTVGPAYISAALAYGWQAITTDRTVTVAGVDRLHAAFNANTWSGRLEGGYRFVAPWSAGVGLTPYAAAQFTTFDLPAYAESVLSGSGAFGLNYASKDVTDARSELGLRTDKSFAMPDAILTLRGRAAWAHDYNPNRAIAATFQALPGASFVVNGAAQATDSALTTASAEVKWTNGWSVAATFEGEFSHVTRSYAGKGVVRYAW